MPFDVTIGYQLATARPSYTPMEGIYAPYPWRAVKDGSPMLDANDPDYPNGRNFGLFKGLEKGELYFPTMYKGAADTSVASKFVMLNYEPVTYQATGACDIVNGAVTFDASVSNSNFGEGSRLLINGAWYDIVSRSSPTTAVLSNNAVNATDVSYTIRGTAFRETDPSAGSVAATAFGLAEFASALAEYAQRIAENGAKIGLYAEVLSHQNARIQHIIGDGHPHRWREWLADVNATAKLKVHQGMSIIDIVNAYGGALAFPAYVLPEFALSPTSGNRRRFRVAMRRINCALRDAGANLVVPMVTPNVANSSWTSTGVYNRAPSGWTGDLIADANLIADGQWGVWGRQRNSGTENECDATFIAELPT